MLFIFSPDINVILYFDEFNQNQHFTNNVDNKIIDEKFSLTQYYWPVLLSDILLIAKPRA